jgi:hypothetical protein
MSTFFADSFAIIEMLKGNKNYQSYQSERLITTEFNICEVGFAVCREYPANATRVLKTVRKMVVIQETRDEDFVQVQPGERKHQARARSYRQSTVSGILSRTG